MKSTARVDNFTKRVPFTADFLATYNVVILASQSDDSNDGPFWSYSAEEAAAFRAWIENGGGVISMIGYSSNNDEITAVNQLIGFSGVKYTTDGNWGSCSEPQACDCSGSQAAVSDWNTVDPVIANLSKGVTLAGFQNGRPIDASADAHVAAKVGETNELVGQLTGQGRILAYGDEWISYTSQWTGAGNPRATDPACQGFLPQDKYQVSQFWYNMIRWAQPAASCFTIVDTNKPIIVW